MHGSEPGPNVPETNGVAVAAGAASTGVAACALPPSAGSFVPKKRSDLSQVIDLVNWAHGLNHLMRFHFQGAPGLALPRALLGVRGWVEEGMGVDGGAGGLDFRSEVGGAVRCWRTLRLGGRGCERVPIHTCAETRERRAKEQEKRLEKNPRKLP